LSKGNWKGGGLPPHMFVGPVGARKHLSGEDHPGAWCLSGTVIVGRAQSSPFFLAAGNRTGSGAEGGTVNRTRQGAVLPGFDFRAVHGERRQQALKGGQPNQRGGVPDFPCRAWPVFKVRGRGALSGFTSAKRAHRRRSARRTDDPRSTLQWPPGGVAEAVLRSRPNALIATTRVWRQRRFTARAGAPGEPAGTGSPLSVAGTLQSTNPRRQSGRRPKKPRCRTEKWRPKRRGVPVEYRRPGKVFGRHSGVGRPAKVQPGFRFLNCQFISKPLRRDDWALTRRR